jgi:Zn finger protein HypA/HybF involved in hydrogenase expression
MLGFILGLVAGLFIMSKVQKFKKINVFKFRFMGYDFQISKAGSEEANVVEYKKKEVKVKKEPAPVKEEVKPSADACEFCNGEDIFIKGSKSIMMCPKCKRNKDKINVGKIG